MSRNRMSKSSSCQIEFTKQSIQLVYVIKSTMPMNWIEMRNLKVLKYEIVDEEDLKAKLHAIN